MKRLLNWFVTLVLGPICPVMNMRNCVNRFNPDTGGPCDTCQFSRANRAAARARKIEEEGPSLWEWMCMYLIADHESREKILKFARAKAQKQLTRAASTRNGDAGQRQK